ncbi:hypothetical protein WA158_008406 [Blastocystis sp. Blastoise]
MSLNEQIAHCLTTLREHNPLCHNITNYVSMDINANVLLAIGASPFMADSFEEVQESVAMVDNTVCNIGTLDRYYIQSMVHAVEKVNELHKQWVLDPVGAGSCSTLLSYSPTVIRGNASEIIALAGIGAGGKGVDSTDSSNSAIEPAKQLALKYNCVVGVSGASDYVTDGFHTYKIDNGTILSTRITAAGCALTSVVGAFVGAGIEPLLATVSAFTIYGLASELAEKISKGPGSLRVNLMDTFYHLTEEDVLKGAKVSEL